MKTDTALRGTSGEIVLYAVTLEHPDGAVVHLHRNGDLDPLLAPLQHPDQVAVDLVGLVVK